MCRTAAIERLAVTSGRSCSLNFSFMQALRYYESVPGPYQTQAAELHIALRDNVLSTVESQYQTTGFLWENYDAITGKGRGTHPFTGWTSLIVLILADQY